MKHQKGYTVVELIFAILFFAGFNLVVFGIFVLIHFINKFW
jgi:hypothetical protein